MASGYRLQRFKISSKSVHGLSRKCSMHASLCCVLVHAYLCVCMHRSYQSAQQNIIVIIGSKHSKFRQNLFIDYQENAPCTLVCLNVHVHAGACTNHGCVHTRVSWDTYYTLQVISLMSQWLFIRSVHQSHRWAISPSPPHPF